MTAQELWRPLGEKSVTQDEAAQGRGFTEPTVPQEGPFSPLSNPSPAEGCLGNHIPSVFQVRQLVWIFAKCFLQLLGINLVPFMKTHSSLQGDRQCLQMPCFPTLQFLQVGLNLSQTVILPGAQIWIPPLQEYNYISLYPRSSLSLKDPLLFCLTNFFE